MLNCGREPQAYAASIATPKDRLHHLKEVPWEYIPDPGMESADPDADTVPHEEEEPEAAGSKDDKERSRSPKRNKPFPGWSEATIVESFKERLEQMIRLKKELKRVSDETKLIQADSRGALVKHRQLLLPLIQEYKNIPDATLSAVVCWLDDENSLLGTA